MVDLNTYTIMLKRIQEISREMAYLKTEVGRIENNIIKKMDDIGVSDIEFGDSRLEIKHKKKHISMTKKIVEEVAEESSDVDAKQFMNAIKSKMTNQPVTYSRVLEVKSPSLY